MTPPDEIIQDLQTRIDEAVAIIFRYGGCDGEHHKDWVLDQALRILLGNSYESEVRAACAGDDGPDTYGWNEGIPP